MALTWLLRRRRQTLEVEQAFRMRAKTVWARLVTVGWLDGEACWAPNGEFILWDGTRIKVRTWDPPRRLGFWWIPQVGDRTPIDVHLTLLPNGHTQVKLEHRGITDDVQARKFRARWKKALGVLAQAQ